MDGEDDPVIDSYDVYLTNAPAQTGREQSSKIFVLQYPSHRKYKLPYNSTTSQTPTSLRLKPATGFLEVDIPILTNEFFNPNTAEKYGKILSQSQIVSVGGTHGLAGGFSGGPPAQTRMRDIPMHEQPPPEDPLLVTQTLGGKIVAPSARDPVYLVGCFEEGKLNLTRVDAVVQMRPQLHHIDAEDEISQKRFQTGNPAAATRQKPGLETPGGKVETKAIELKIKDNKEDARDRSLNENARLLRDIQVDAWQHYNWIDEHDDQAKAAFDTNMHLRAEAGHSPIKLRSAISNGDWLDRMSAPREDGKKGLLAKLRGRERERQRRKKAEEEKRQRQKEITDGTTTAPDHTLDMSSESDLSSSESEAGEDIAMTGMEDVDSVPIKEEPAAANLASTTTTTPKKRGRPKKSQGPDAASGEG